MYSGKLVLYEAILLAMKRNSAILNSIMRNLHLLIACDQNTLSPYLKKTLEGDGFKVTNYSEGQNSPQSLLDTQYALIVVCEEALRMTLPSLLTEFAAQLPQTPILLLSNGTEKKAREEYKKFGVEYFLETPFAFQDLLTKVQAILEKSTLLADELTLDNLTVDTKTNVVKRGGKSIVLTKKELILLTYLMRHRNRAVSRADLLENVWGMQIDPLSNTIEAHILSLRHKIDTAGQTKLIHTIPKFGYRMSVDK